MKKEEYITALVRQLRLITWKKGCEELCPLFFFPLPPSKALSLTAPNRYYQCHIISANESDSQIHS